MNPATGQPWNPVNPHVQPAAEQPVTSDPDRAAEGSLAAETTLFRLLVMALLIGALVVFYVLIPARLSSGVTSSLLSQARHYAKSQVAQTWRCQDSLEHSRTKAGHPGYRSPSLAYVRWVGKKWHHRGALCYHKLHHPPHLADWLCIHSHEGAWNDNTGNGYYGGLQLNMEEMQTFSPHLLKRKGTANNWSDYEQIWGGERDRQVRGWSPWPQTARMCGLL